jgi:hypothetical protein
MLGNCFLSAAAVNLIADVGEWQQVAAGSQLSRAPVPKTTVRRRRDSRNAILPRVSAS